MTDQGKREWVVSGMDCAACTTKVTRAVERLPGVSAVRVALMSERLSLNLEPEMTQPEEIEAVVRKLGFGIAPKGHDAPRKKAFVLPQASEALQTPGPSIKGACATGCCPPASLPDDATDDPNYSDAAHSHDNPAERGKPWFQTAKGRLVILTGLLLAVAWIFELLTSAEAGYWAFLAACLIGVAPVAQRAFAALRGCWRRSGSRGEDQ